MKLEQIYTGCLAHAAYYLESEGEAAIFDPLREVFPYIDRAEKEGAKINYVFETHFHADFVSGHLDLAAKTNAKIVYGPTAKPEFDALVAEDGQVFKVGAVKIKVIHTPGHTLESTCFLIIDENDKEHGIISGDTLFIGDVGRPDLAQHVIADLTEEKLARMLYHSLHEKIMPLADDLIVYPNHGAGSACGKKMSKETTDTLGNQKATNYALNPALSEDEFVVQLLTGLTTPPKYFPENVLMNIKGYSSLDTILHQGQKAYDAKTFELIANETKAVIIDSRSAVEFAKGFIPNSINIGLDGSFGTWVGELITDIRQPILIVAENEDNVKETIIRLSRVGFDHSIGYLQGGFKSWVLAGKEFEQIDRISSADFDSYVLQNNPILIDVRRKSEYDSEHFVESINIPLNAIYSHLAEFPKELPFIIFCAGGYRSMIAASILKSRGYENFVDIIEGFGGLKNSTLPKSDYKCPTTLL
ncbi:MAG: hypothetical protein RLZZ500_2150 [Bacteroidota bacterium]|jgi:glyoxylase-like metal-dependent hydrolase (beta-lactamase superfamily II)/rhodanese-related sulfurtransferase